MSQEKTGKIVSLRVPKLVMQQLEDLEEAWGMNRSRVIIHAITYAHSRKKRSSKKEKEK